MTARREASAREALAAAVRERQDADARAAEVEAEVAVLKEQQSAANIR